MSLSKKNNFSASSWLGGLVEDPKLADQIVFVAEQPPRTANYRKLSLPLNPLLTEKLAQNGIEQFYAHQALAYEAAMNGENLIVCTGTNSGKSLCYNLPALNKLLEEPNARALYLFPTKALARDQATKLAKLAPDSHVRVACYDGDTAPRERTSIRKLAHVIVSNPDMLHVGILPSHERWTSFL